MRDKLLLIAKDSTIYAVLGVEISDELPTMQQLLARLAASSFTVLKVERVTASLEEIFLKVAGQRETI